MVHLAYARTSEEALTYFRDHQLEEEIRGMTNETFNKTLQCLLFEKMIMNIPQYFREYKEREFAEDYIQIEKIPQISGETRFLTEKLRECKMVLYFSDDGKIKTLRSNLTVVFPDMPLYEQINQYCANHSSLWDVVSVISEHTPGKQPPTNACRPRPEDYTNYINDLLLAKRNGLASVIQFLIS